MNKKEITEVLSEKSFPDHICAYCGGLMDKGYYAEANIGRRLSFPKVLTRPFVAREVYELPIHFKCIKPFIKDMLREGECFNGEKIKGTTKLIIRN